MVVLSASGVLAGALLVAGPALGAALARGVQPPPGTVDNTPDGVVPVGRQPAPGTVDNTPYGVVPVARQPVNPNPDLTGESTQLKNLKETGTKSLRIGKDGNYVDNGGDD
jgi:hypothetical protein